MTQLANYIILDAARAEQNMFEARKLNKKFVSLYRGEAEEDLSDVAPYLFTFENGSPFANWFLENGWGNSWGILVKSDFSFEELRSHFRRFLLVKTDDGAELYFRFYDPRVLRIFLPTCDKEQLQEFFGPIESFICEDENPDYALIFSLRNSMLKIDLNPKDKMFYIHFTTIE